MRKNALSRPLLRLTLLAGLWLPVVGYAGNSDGAGPAGETAAAENQELVCLAMNIYHEGRSESARGQAAIAAVTMNRLHSPRYPDSVCEVVWQRDQFSWTRLDAHHHAVDDAKAWDKALVIAELFLNGARLALVSEATHYHTVDVQPFWSRNIPAVALIGKHIFYAL